MHIFATAAATFDDLPVAVDLRQSPGEMVALSFTDSDLGGLAAAWAREADVAAEPAPGPAARSAPPDVGRPVDRAGRPAMRG